jgi:hypothetical protein
MANLNAELSGIGACFWLSLPAHIREEFKNEEICLSVQLEKIEPSGFDDEDEQNSWDFLVNVSDNNLNYDYFINADIQTYIEEEISTMDVQELLDKGIEGFVSDIEKPKMFLKEKL